MIKCLLIPGIVAMTLAIVGCGDGDLSQAATDIPTVTVMYQSSPLADVQVGLHRSIDGPVLVQAITSVDGRARFAAVPSPEPSEYFVSLESIGDGGWILDSTIVQRDTESLRLKPFSQNQSQSIELPPRAVRSLNPSRK